MANEKTASLPMLSLSGRQRKEAFYVNSPGRAYRRYVLVSSSIASGHENLPHGPLFSALAGLDQRSKRPGLTRWSLEFLLFTALLMVYESGSTLQDRFRNARECLIEMFPGRRRPGKSYTGFVKAWRRFTPRMHEALKQHLREAHRSIAGSFQKRWGWSAFACDGSRVEVPRTAANEKALGCAGRTKTGPQLFVTTLYHMGTGLPWDWTIGRGTESERDHLRRMLTTLPADSLIVADAGFTGFELLREILAQGHSFLIRVGANVTLLTELELEVERHRETVWLWPLGKREESPLKLRLIRLTKSVAGPSSEMCLLTNVFDRERLSEETAGVLYRMRWGVELFYRGFKQTLEQRKLRSDSPDQARWELQMGVVAMLLLGLMSVAGIIAAQKDPLSWSVGGALRIVRTAMRTPRRWRRRGDLRVLLLTAVQDGHVRTGSKQARAWPHKKRDRPPGLPKMRPATADESRCATERYREAGSPCAHGVASHPSMSPRVANGKSFR